MKHPLFIVFLLLLTLLLSGCSTSPVPAESVSPPPESETLLEPESILPRQIPIEVTYLEPSFGLETDEDPIDVLQKSGFERFYTPSDTIDCRARIFRTAEELFSSAYTEMLHVTIYDAEGQHRYVPFLEEYPKKDWNRYFETHDLIMVYDSGTGITPEIQTLTQDLEKNRCELLLHTYYSEGLISMVVVEYLMLVEVEKGVFETADGKTLSLIVREEWLPMSVREEKP